MFTAKDLYSKVKQNKEILLSGLDKWIESYLTEQFTRHTTLSIKIIASKVPYPKEQFIEAMGERGFSVEFACEDRPCGYCFYSITIPPQAP